METPNQPDPAPSGPPPIIQPPADAGTVTDVGPGTATGTGSGLPANVASGLAELIPLLGGIVFYALDKQKPLVRFHAMQSIYFGAAWIILSVVLTILSAIPLLGFLFWIVWIFAGLAAFVLWLIAVFKGFNGVEWEMPLLGPMVKSQLAKNVG